MRKHERSFRQSLETSTRFPERSGRTIKYEEVSLHDYQIVREGTLGIGRYIEFYNHRRLYQALNYRTPSEVHFQVKDSWLVGTTM